MPFIVRLQTVQGVKRILFDDDNKTFEDFLFQVADVTGVPPEKQQFSKTPLQAPSFLTVANRATKLKDIPLKQGDLLYFKAPAPSNPPSGAAPASSSAPAPPAKPKHKLTARCQHGPNGRCVHCLGEPEEPTGNGATKANPKAKCTHGPHETCFNCSQYIKDPETKDQVAPWLCNHPETAFCPKCIPKEPEGEEGETKTSFLKCSCNKARGQECVVCVDKGPKIKANFVPYAFFMKERKAMCRFNHPASQVCASCAAPKTEDYKGNPNCTKGHAPWPHGVCTSCQPPNANLRLQKYRHCDRVTFQDPTAIRTFRDEWQAKGFDKQIGGILLGRYIEEPEELGGIRAEVFAIYEPPQESLQGGGFRFLRDPKEDHVTAVAKKLDLIPVGWVITTKPRSGDKYGGKVFLSGAEIIQAAAFQNKFKNDLGHSRFVTVVVEPDEPFAYQVSDQCTALQRDGVLETAPDPFMITTHVPKPAEMVPTVIYRDNPLLPGTPFLVDDFLVKANVMQPQNPQPKFYHCDFPSNGGKPHLLSFLEIHKNQPYHVKLSDFNLLVNLASLTSGPLAEKVVTAIATGSPFPDQLTQELNRAFK